MFGSRALDTGTCHQAYGRDWPGAEGLLVAGSREKRTFAHRVIDGFATLCPSYFLLFRLIAESAATGEPTSENGPVENWLTRADVSP